MVDVGINVYGKPWQTLCSLESLYTHSEKWIDKLYFLEEAKHPYNDSVDWVLDYFTNYIHHKYDKWINIYSVKSSQVPYSNIRHQYIIDKSDKKNIFIMHNDILFTEDVIGNMLNLVGKGVAGIGAIGQCWNCPFSEMCGGGEKWNDWNPKYEDLLTVKLPHIRTTVNSLDRNYPKLVPECRLNEWASLIDRELCKKYPTPHFGDFDEDSGVQWFKAMNKRGYKFKNYNKGFQHCYWAQEGGNSNMQDEAKYRKAEENAKKYFKENFE